MWRRLTISSSQLNHPWLKAACASTPVTLYEHLRSPKQLIFWWPWKFNVFRLGRKCTKQVIMQLNFGKYFNHTENHILCYSQLLDTSACLVPTMKMRAKILNFLLWRTLLPIELLLRGHLKIGNGVINAMRACYSCVTSGCAVMGCFDEEDCVHEQQCEKYSHTDIESSLFQKFTSGFAQSSFKCLLADNKDEELT